MFSWLLLAALGPSVARAEAISLPEAVALAVVKHPDADAARLQRDAAEAQVKASRAAYDPELISDGSISRRKSRGFIAGYPSSSDSDSYSVSAGVQGELPTGSSYAVKSELTRDITNTTAALGGASSEQTQSTWSETLELSVTQDLLAMFRSSPAQRSVRTASEALERAEIERLRSIDAAIAEAAEAWWACYGAIAARTVASSALAEVDALLERTVALAEVGEIARLEVDRVKADRLDAELRQIEADADARAKMDALLILIGGRPGEAIALEGEPLVWEHGALDAREAVEEALANNPDLALAQSEIDAAEAALRDARQDRLPSLVGTGTVGAATLDESLSGALSGLSSDERLPYVTGGISLTVPLSGRAASAANDKASADLSRARRAFEARASEIEAEVRSAVDTLEVRRRGLQIAEAKLAVARATEEGERARLGEGTRRLDEILEAMADRIEAEEALTEARTAQASAELVLTRLEGRLMGEVARVE